MKYQEILDYLYSQLPMFHRIGAAAYKADLEKTLKLAELLGNPQNKLKVIHIAGTNGKGSVSHLLASVLQEAGYKTGLYTSPHLRDFRERIRINGKMISKSAITGFIKRHKPELDIIRPSFFEMTFGLCLDYFSKNKTEVAIMETGMGGRLDSTNILHPDLCIITNIGFDHMAFLGDTLPKIAAEKAGIIKAGIPVVVGEAGAETRVVFKEKAASVKAPLFFSKEIYKVEKLKESSFSVLMVKITKLKNKENFEVSCPLAGEYQLENLSTLMAAIDLLKHSGYRISQNEVIAGISKVKENTGFMGRWEILRTKPLVICDTGHNPDGIKAVLSQIQTLKYRNLHFVLGMVEDKDISRILRMLPLSATYYFCKADIPRGLDANELARQASNVGLQGIVYSSAKEAYAAALSESKSDDLVFVGGSTFIVAEVI